METTLVTIGITSFNASDTIERAIKSALSQNWKPVEIVIVDDCSTDDTLEIINKVSVNRKNIRVFSQQKNKGVASARNKIIENAKGDFVVFFDDDDQSLPGRIKEQIQRILKYEQEFSERNPVICHTARKLIYPNGEIRIESTMGETEKKRAPSGLAVARRILLGTPLEDGYGACPTCSQMARTSTYRDIGGFDEKLRRCEDTDFNIRLALAGGHFVGISNPLVTQFMTNSSDKSLKSEYNNMLYLLEKNRILLETEGMYDFCIEWLKLKHAWLEKRKIDFLFHLAKLCFKKPLVVFQRIWTALPNIQLNNSFGRFHTNKKC